MSCISDRRTLLILRDMLDGQHDLPELARRHKLTLTKLATWIDEPENQRNLRGMCVLADMQTQLLLSRYRMLAASRLIRMATDEESGGDITRRACVDLLKLEMKRASIDKPADSQDDDPSLRDVLYAKLNEGGRDSETAND